MNSRKLGSEYEDQACRYLLMEKAEILERNYNSHRGEIDIIIMDNGTLAFVEVKYRSSDSSGSSLEAVSPAKQRAISKTALAYLTSHPGYYNKPCRFDVIGIDGENITWIKNAFDFCVSNNRRRY